MKNNNTRKNLISIISGVLLFISFSACKNFMNSESVKKEIQNTIAYNNALTCQILLKAQQGTGEFLSDGEKDCKEGYTIDIQFTLNSAEYVFKGFKAVGKTDETKSLAENVEIIDTSTEIEKKNGVYKAKVILLKLSDDIMIRPDCLLIPKVLDITPGFSPQGYDQDSIIQVKFNKSVNPESFGDFKDILSIYSDTEDLASYFGTPYFSENNTVLSIPPVQGKYILAPDSNRKLDVTIDIDFTTVKDVDGLTVEPISPYKYRINDSFGNQVKVKFLLRAEEGFGKFDTEGEIECSMGFEYQIQYRVDTSKYYFVGLEAYSRDGTQSKKDSVTFIENQKDDANGNYDISVIITNNTNDILIKPKCLLLPAAESHTPVSDKQNQYANTPIKIYFNMPMDRTFNFSNVHISYNDESLENLFETPVLSDDKKVLTIKPIATELIKYLESKSMYLMVMDVSLSEDLSIVKDGVTLPLQVNSHSSFAVCYMAEWEKEIPVYRDLFVTKKEMSLQTAASITEKFNNDTIYSKEGFTEEQFTQKVMQNLVRDTVYIYGCYYDGESGVKSVEVNELTTHDPQDGNLLQNKPTVTVYTTLSENAEFVTVNGETKFCIKHKITQQNGPVRLTVTVKDACENAAESLIYYAIKKDSFDNNGSSIGSNLYNAVGRNNSSSWKDFDYTEETYLEAIKAITLNMSETIQGDVQYSAAQVYLDVTLPQDSYSMKCRYIDKTGALCEEEMVPESNPWDYVWKYSLNVDHVAGLSVTIVGTDILGNTSEEIFSFPEPMTKDDCFVVLNNFQSEGYFTYSIYDKRTLKEIPNYSHYLVKTDSTGKSQVRSNYSTVPLSTSNTYRMILGNSYLSGEFVNGFSFSTADYDSSYVLPAAIKVSDMHIEETEDPFYYDVVITLQDNEESSWRNYDYVAIGDPMSDSVFNEENGTFVKRFRALSLRNFNWQFRVGGYIGNRKTVSDFYQFPTLELDDWNIFDTDPPSFWLTSWSSLKKDEYVVYNIGNDNLSGTKQGNIKLENEEGTVIKTYNAEYIDGYFRIIIPAWEISPKNGFVYTIKYEVEDKAGNKASGTEVVSPVNYINSIDLVGRRENGDVLLAVDNEYSNWAEYFSTYSFKLNTENGCEWQLDSSDSLSFKRYPSNLNDYFYLEGKPYTEEYCDEIKQFIKHVGISESYVGNPQFKVSPFSKKYEEKDAYLAKLKQAGIPEECITATQGTGSNSGSVYIQIDWFTIPQNTNVDEFYELLTSNSGELKIGPDYIQCRIPITNTKVIPKNPYKELVVYDGADMSSDCFIKLCSCESGGYDRIMNSVIFYNGTPGSGEYDWILENGHSKDYLFVCSDAPVYVHTLITELPYEDCVNWNIKEWLTYKQSVGDKYYNFSATDKQQRRYAIPKNDIPKGASYIVVAHFSDGHIDYSPVYHQ